MDMNEVLFTQDVTLKDFIIRIVCYLPIISLMLGVVINDIIIKPIKRIIERLKR